MIKDRDNSQIILGDLGRPNVTRKTLLKMEAKVSEEEKEPF